MGRCLMKEKIFAYIEEHKQQLFDMLCEMIDINTENSGITGGEKPLAEYMQRAFSALGVESDVYTPDSVEGLISHPDYLAGRHTDERPNITARLHGTAPRKALMLAGHLDTVPIGDESLWATPPTKGVIRDGRIYGRGACDDKFALAVEVFLAKAFTELGISTENDILLTGYVDEEYGGGNGALAACVKYPCDFAINMDSDDMDIIHCGVGGQRLALCLKHRDTQDACNDMIEAIYLTKKCIDKFGARRRAELAQNKYFKDTVIPQTALRFMNAVTGLNTNDRHLGTVDFAFYTDRSRKEIEAEYQALFAEITAVLDPLRIDIDRVIWRSRFFCYAAADKGHPNIKLLRRAIGAQTGREPKVCGMCLSDLNLFINCLDGNAISCGVCRDFSDIGGSHQPNEFVVCDELVQFTKSIVDFILEWDKK